MEGRKKPLLSIVGKQMKGTREDKTNL